MKRTGPLSPDEALARCQALCAAAERCSRELLEKMHRWGLTRQSAESIIAALRRDRFLDDSRFAHAFVRDRCLGARWGRLKVRAALAAKSIPRDIVEVALAEEVDAGRYDANLRALLRRRITALGDEARTYDGRTRLFRYAASRGYETALVAAALRDPSIYATEGDT